MKHNTIPKLGASLLAALGLTAAANAAFIQGTIDFAGSAIMVDSSNVVTSDLAAACAVQSWPAAFVLSTDGNYAGVPLGTTVTLATPWTFCPPGPETPLWSINGYAGMTFDLVSATVVTQNSAFLNIKGSGIAHMVGYDDTPGTWLFTSQGSAGSDNKFSWSSNSAVTPDGGTTMALFGVSLLGLGAVRRKLLKL
jgi:hypothetical protein